MYLAKFIARAGVCSRRKASKMVKDGFVTVNGDVCTDPSNDVGPSDEVVCDGSILKLPIECCYVLLNKPSGYLTAYSDPHGRATVMGLVDGACSERIYPIGRLDRATTGLLLFTNDGDLAYELAHPKFGVSKRYVAVLDKEVDPGHLKTLQNGIVLVDGEIHVDTAFYPISDKLDTVAVEIHSGRNRIVRRMFKHLGYRVQALDRVEYAGLKQGRLCVGKWRHLTEDEIRLLKKTT